jgi:hypothetical protein
MLERGLFYIRFLRGGSHRTILTIALPFVLLLACPWQLAIKNFKQNIPLIRDLIRRHLPRLLQRLLTS